MLTIKLQRPVEPYDVLSERDFESFEDAGEYLTTIAYNSREYKRDEKYYLNLAKEIFNEKGSMHSSIVWKDNRDKNQINYSIEHKDYVKDFVQPHAWGRGYSLAEVFPQDWLDLEEAFNEFIKEIEETEECVDSYRIGLANSEESMKEYDSFVSCCGSTDKGVTVNGELYMFGCNYGH